MAKQTHKIPVSLGAWTALSSGQGNVIVQQSGIHPIRVAMAESGADLADDDGHVVTKGAVPFLGITANVFARAFEADCIVVVTRW